MVIRFFTIPPLLQMEITDKIEREDLKNLRLSSKLGKNLANYVQSIDTMKIRHISINKKGVKFYLYPYDHKMVYLKNIRKRKYWPRFCAQFIYFEPDVSRKKCETFVKQLEEGRFIGSCKCFELNAARGTFDESLFNRLLKVVNAETLVCSDMDPMYLTQPSIQEIKYIFYHSTMEEEAFLGLKATAIGLYSSISPSIKSTIATLLKQWFNNERELEYFSVLNSYGNKWTETDYDDMLSDLPYSVQWTPESHDYTVIGEKISLETFQHYYMDYMPTMFYSIQRGSKTLLIRFSITSDRNGIVAEEVSDIQKALLDQVCADGHEQLTGRPRINYVL